MPIRPPRPAAQHGNPGPASAPRLAASQPSGGDDSFTREVSLFVVVKRGVKKWPTRLDKVARAGMPVIPRQSPTSFLVYCAVINRPHGQTGTTRQTGEKVSKGAKRHCRGIPNLPQRARGTRGDTTAATHLQVPSERETTVQNYVQFKFKFTFTDNSKNNPRKTQIILFKIHWKIKRIR